MARDSQRPVTLAAEAVAAEDRYSNCSTLAAFWDHQRPLLPVLRVRPAAGRAWLAVTAVRRLSVAGIRRQEETTATAERRQPRRAALRPRAMRMEQQELTEVLATLSMPEVQRPIRLLARRLEVEVADRRQQAAVLVLVETADRSGRTLVDRRSQAAQADRQRVRRTMVALRTMLRPTNRTAVLALVEVVGTTAVLAEMEAEAVSTEAEAEVVAAERLAATAAQADQESRSS